MTVGEQLQVLQGRGETTGHRPRVRWVMAVGVVIRGMTACLTVAAAVAVVTLLLIISFLVTVVVDGVALSLLRSSLQYFVPSIRAGELFFHLQHRSGASRFVMGSSAQANGCPVLQSMKRMWLLGERERYD